MTDQIVALVEQLASLTPKLSSGEDFENTRAEALRLTKKITAGLEPPETTAVQLAYFVRNPSINCAVSCEVMRRADAN